MAKNSGADLRCWAILGAILLTASVAIGTAVAADQAVTGQAATGAASVVDLKNAPELANPYPPVNPDRTLHNNISWADHVAAKKKAARDLGARSPIRGKPELQK